MIIDEKYMSLYDVQMNDLVPKKIRFRDEEESLLLPQRYLYQKVISLRWLLQFGIILELYVENRHRGYYILHSELQ